MSEGNRTMFHRLGDELKRANPKLAKAPSDKLGKRAGRTGASLVSLAVGVTAAALHWHLAIQILCFVAAVKLYSDEAFNAIVRLIGAWRGKNGKDEK